MAWRVAAGAAAAASCVSPVAAQDDADVTRRLERQMREADAAYRLAVPQDQPIAERLLLDYGGNFRFGFFSIDAPVGDSRFLRQSDLRLYLRAELDGAHRFYARARFQYNDFNTGDDFDGRGDELIEPLGEQYWYQFDYRGWNQARTGQRLPWNVNVKAGKQFVHWASGLTLSDELYAGLIDVEAAELGLIGLAGITPSSDTIDFDGSRPGFDSDTERAFYGLMLEHRGLDTHRPYVFFLAQQDENDKDFIVFESVLDTYPTRFQYDSNYVGFGSRGTIGPALRYHAEIVHEFGEGLSNSFSSVTALSVPQTEEDIDAWAGVAGLTYLFRDANESRLDFEVVAGTGDADRFDSADTFGGNRSGTDDNSFVSLGYVNTGLALSPEPANLLSFRLGASTEPWPNHKSLRDLRAGINTYIFSKIDSDAPLNIRTEDGTFVGGEVDVFVDWRVLSDVTANLRYGVFLPGEAMPEDEDGARHFFYAGVSYSF